MKIISWNVNGIRALNKKVDLNEYLRKKAPTFFCIGETKLSMPDQAEIDKLKNSISGFRYRYFNTSKAKKGYSGVAIFSKRKPITVEYKIDEDLFDHEGRSITLEFENFYLVNVYVPNSGQVLQRIDDRTQIWDRQLEKYIFNLEKKKPVILVGDLNCARLEIDVHNPKTCAKLAGFTPQERNSFDKLLDKTKLIDSYRYFYPDKANIYTYWSYRQRSREKNKGWRIDYCLVSKKLESKLKHAFIEDEMMGSDHCPVGVEFNKK